MILVNLKRVTRTQKTELRITEVAGNQDSLDTDGAERRVPFDWSLS